MVRFSHLPEKLVEEIMSRVPAESLLQFKRVNKSYYFLMSQLINNRAFVAKHIGNTLNKSSYTSLVFEKSIPIPSDDDDDGDDSDGDLIDDDETVFSLLSLSNDDGDKNLLCCLTEELNLPPLPKGGFENSSRSWKVICHCDGIICLVSNPMAIMLCNPLLQEFKLLPESKYAKPDTSCLGIGFGYDSRTKDYKIVRILQNVGAEIYTRGTETWKGLSIPKDIEDLTDREDALHWKGVCYWAMEDANEDMIVLSFDMCDEVFHIIPFPNDTTLPMNWMSLTVWNDSVALFLSSREANPGSTSFEICVLGEYRDILAGARPWIKHLVVRPQLGVMVPLTFWKGDEILMEDSGGTFFSYNLYTQKLRNTGVKGTVNLPVSFYEKSLVSLRKGYMKLDSKRRKANR